MTEAKAKVALLQDANISRTIADLMLDYTEPRHITFQKKLDEVLAKSTEPNMEKKYRETVRRVLGITKKRRRRKRRYNRRKYKWKYKMDIC